MGLTTHSRLLIGSAMFQRRSSQRTSSKASPRLTIFPRTTFSCSPQVILFDFLSYLRLLTMWHSIQNHQPTMWHRQIPKDRSPNLSLIHCPKLMPQSSMEGQPRLLIRQPSRFRRGSQWQMLLLSQVHSGSYMCVSAFSFFLLLR